MREFPPDAGVLEEMASAIPTTEATRAAALSLLGCSANDPAAQTFPDTRPSDANECRSPLSPAVSQPVSPDEPRQPPVAETAPQTRALECPDCESTAEARPEVPKILHRIAEVRSQQGISERTVARRLGIEVKRYRRWEDPANDLPISSLMAVQEALDVPLIDLLQDNHSLSRPVQERAKMVKVMKTAVALREAKCSPRVERMAQMLCEQLVDVMPELAEISGWPQFGTRRGQTALGKALSHPIDTTLLGQMD